MQCVKHLTFQFRVETGVGKQRVVDANVANVERQRTADARRFKGRQHQGNNLAVCIGGTAAIEFSTELNRRPSTDNRLRCALKGRAGITEPRHTLFSETMRIHSRCLRRDIRSDAQHSAAHLIGELAGHHVQVSTQTHQQRVSEFD